MFGGDVPRAGQVGGSAGKLAYLVVSAGAEAEFLHRRLQEHFAGRIEPAEILDLFVAHSGVGVNLPVAEAPGLDARGPDSVGTHGSRVELARFRGEAPATLRRH